VETRSRAETDDVVCDDWAPDSLRKRIVDFFRGRRTPWPIRRGREPYGVLLDLYETLQQDIDRARRLRQALESVAEQVLTDPSAAAWRAEDLCQLLLAVGEIGDPSIVGQLLRSVAENQLLQPAPERGESDPYAMMLGVLLRLTEGADYGFWRRQAEAGYFDLVLGGLAEHRAGFAWQLAADVNVPWTRKRLMDFECELELLGDMDSVKLQAFIDGAPQGPDVPRGVAKLRSILPGATKTASNGGNGKGYQPEVLRRRLGVSEKRPEPLWAGPAPPRKVA